MYIVIYCKKKCPITSNKWCNTGTGTWHYKNKGFLEKKKGATDESQLSSKRNLVLAI
jgi:hypothetical protein